MRHKFHWRLWLLVILLGLSQPTCSHNSTPAASVPDVETRENIAAALWLSEYDETAIPAEILGRINSGINSDAAFGERMRWRLSSLLASPDSFTPDYTELYKKLGDYSARLTPHQAYAMTALLGLDSSGGYQGLPQAVSFKYPQDDRPQFEYQVGWHFFVGSVFSEEGDEFGVQMMFWTYSLLPPAAARSFGLSDAENQVTEMHFAITPAGGKHYRAKPTMVAGTTGLITYSSAPFRFSMGKNYMGSSRADSLFPLELRARGVDRTETNPVEIEMDLFLNQVKGYILQGDEGLAPSCGGVGTLYYSVPNLSLDPSLSWLRIAGRKFRISKGKMWYDHQWGTGFMPDGNPRSEILRAAQYLQYKKKVPGWDWTEIQFDDNTEIALSSLHSSELADFYQQTGEIAPGTMVADAKGLYIDQAGAASKVSGRIKVTEWIRSTVSHGQYMATQTWYPNKVEVTLDTGNLPEEKKSFVLVPIVKTGQQGFFSAGMQYSEGAVYVEKAGARIGRGFLESTGYNDSLKQTLRLAGLPETAEMIRILDTRKPSEELIRQSTQFLSLPQNTLRLMQEAGACRGL